MKKMQMLWVMVTITTLLIAGCSKKEVQPPLPADSGLYVNMTGLGESWEQFKTTQFYQDLLKLDLWKDPGIAKGVAEARQNLPLPDPAAFAFNQEIAAILSDHRVDISVRFTGIMPQVVTVFDLGEKGNVVKIADYLNKTFGSKPVSTQEYQKIQISTIPIEGPFSLSYYFHKNLLIASNDVLAIQTTIDVLRKRTPGFLESDVYKKLLEGTASFANRIYFAPATMQQFIEKQPEEARKAFQELVDDYQEFKMAWNFGKTGADSLIRIDFKPASKFLVMFPKNGREGASEALIPDNTILASSASIMFKDMYLYHKNKLLETAEASQKEMIQAGIGAANQALGLDIEQELFEILGNEIFWCVQSVNSGGFAPIPETVFGIEIRDEARARALLVRIENLIAQTFGGDRVAFSETDIAGLVYRSVPLPFGNNLNPGYAIAGKFLLLATSPAGITEAQKTTRGERKGILKDEKFLGVASENAGNSVGYQYMNLELFWKAISDIVNNYRILLPKDINPDHLRAACTTLGLIDSYFADAAVGDTYLESRLKIRVR